MPLIFDDDAAAMMLLMLMLLLLLMLISDAAAADAAADAELPCRCHFRCRLRADAAFTDARASADAKDAPLTFIYAFDYAAASFAAPLFAAAMSDTDMLSPPFTLERHMLLLLRRCRDALFSLRAIFSCHY